MPAISPLLFLASLAIGVAINVFFCLTLIKTLSLISNENRRMSPMLVWLLLVPGFNVFWNFFTVGRIAQSIKNELDSRDYDVKGYPTLIVGLAYSVLSCAVLFIPAPKDISSSPAIGILGLAVIIAFVQYWSKVNWYKKVLQNDEAEVASKD